MIAVETIPAGGLIVKIPAGVAVMAETFGQCWDACNVLDITWGDGPLKGENDATIRDKLRAAIPPMVPGLPGTISIDAEFTWKAASAAPLEVECAIVDATRPDFVEIWAGMQTPIVAAQSTAIELGLLPTQVVAHCIPSGWAFGRRLFWDPVQVAAQVSKKTGLICKLMYHRSDDIRHTRMRLSLVLKTSVNIQNGLPQEGSYNPYTFAKMRDFPKDVQIIIMPNVGEAASGMGEVAMTAPSGAIANAYARATGIEPRNFPLNAQPVYTPTPAGQLPAVPDFT